MVRARYKAGPFLCSLFCMFVTKKNFFFGKVPLKWGRKNKKLLFHVLCFTMFRKEMMYAED